VLAAEPSINGTAARDGYCETSAVVVTSTWSVAESEPPPITVTAQLPAATGVTVSEFAATATEAMPAQPEIANWPLKPAWATLTICAYAAPTAVKLSVDGLRLTLPNADPGAGVGMRPVGAAVGVAVAVGAPTGVALAPGVGVALAMAVGVAVATAVGVGAADGLAVAVGVAVGAADGRTDTGLDDDEPPPEHAASASVATVADSRSVRVRRNLGTPRKRRRPGRSTRAANRLEHRTKSRAARS
jgi:hypothetical protein